MFATGFLGAPTPSARWYLRRSLHARYRLSSRISKCLPSQQQRGFGCTSRCGQEEDEEAVLDDESATARKARFPRQKHPLGRIIGKAGRRQREGSARLGTNALNKPFEVVVLRDVPQAKAEQVKANLGAFRQLNGDNEPSAARIIESSISEENKEPSQDDIDESIDSLRPDLSSLGAEQYVHLHGKLVAGYTTQQLSRYLTKALNLGSVDADAVHLIPVCEGGGRGRKLAWRPGRTQLEKRHSLGTVVKKTDTSASRPKIAKQIIQLAWNLNIQSEEQQIGELEVPLDRWQLAFLFDLNENERPIFERFIDSSLLLRAGEVRPYRPHNMMRITARRRDAEEIAWRIESKLCEVRRLDVSLHAFEPLLGSDGWPARFEDLIEDADLKDVGERTATVIDRTSASVIAIYSQHLAPKLHARRLLLSLLQLPSPRSIIVLEDLASHLSPQANDRVYLPESPKSSLPFRHRRLELVRLSSSSRRLARSGFVAQSIEAHRDHLDPKVRSRGGDGDLKSRLSRSLATHLIAAQPSYPSRHRASTDPKSCWSLVQSVEPWLWEADFCKILKSASIQAGGMSTPQTASRIRDGKISKPSPGSKVPHASIIQPKIPGIASLLSYFTPSWPSQVDTTTHPNAIQPTTPVKPPYLLAHFVPSPFTARGVQAEAKLPRIEIRYIWSPHHSASTEFEDSPRSLQATSMEAYLEEQEVHVPLPDESCDLRFTRKTSLKGKKHILGAGAGADKEIQRFTHELQKSISKGTGALHSSARVMFRLPAWVLETDSMGQARRADRDVETEYLFERFEQVQTMDFVPAPSAGDHGQHLDPGVKAVLEKVPTFFSLRYMEVEGGVAGGRTTGLTLKVAESSRSRGCGLKKTMSDDLAGVEREDEHSREDLSSGSDSDARSLDNGTETHTSKLVDAALDFVHLLTRFNARELQAKKGDL